MNNESSREIEINSKRPLGRPEQKQIDVVEKDLIANEIQNGGTIF